jgi:hypothetical protein
MNNYIVSIGHTVSFVIQYLDALGNPMLTTPTPDSPPTWTDTPTPAGCVTQTVSADSLSDVETAVAAGSDVVGVSLSVAGTAFSASAGITVSPAPQVLTSIALVGTVN